MIFDGRTVRVRDLKGMRYLARLLADPGREYHVEDSEERNCRRGATGAVVERHVRRSSVRITRVTAFSGYGLRVGHAVPPGAPGTRAAR